MVCLCVSLAVAAETQAEPAEAARHLEAGNQRYAQGDYRGALQAYGQALSTGYANAALYYNAGNAYFRLSQIGQAIRFYEKARRLAPEDERIRHNLEVARARVRDQLPVLPEPYWVRWWRWIAALGPQPLFGAGYLFWTGTAALLAHRVLTGIATVGRRRVLIISAVLGLTLMGTAFAASYTRDHSCRAVLVASEAAVREAPAFGAGVTTTVHEGLAVRVLDRDAGWLQVRLPDGTTGWIEAHTAAGI